MSRQHLRSAPHPATTHRSRGLASAAPAALLLAIALAGPADAATHCVNPGGTGGCFASIQSAVAAASSGDVVSVAAGTYAEQVAIGPPKRLRLDGAGPGATVIQPATGEAITVGAATRVEIAGVSLQGGGLELAETAAATVTNCAIDPAGGFAAYAGARTRLTLTDCAITGSDGAGAVYSLGSRLDVVRTAIHDNVGGGIYTTAKLEMMDSSIQDNGPYGVQLLGGRIRGSTVSGNLAYGVLVGRSYPAGGGTVRIERSTIDDNFFGGVFVNERFAAIVDHSTISDNGEFGLAVSSAFYRAPGRGTLRSSIVSGHATGDCSGPVRTRGVNVVEDPTGCTIAGSAPITGDPLLGPLADNGGPTETRAPGAGSPALGVVTDSSCRDPDQRGVPRTVPCDAGAYEAP